AGVGLTSLASGICQVVVLVLFAVWAGSSSDTAFSLPKASDVAVAVLVVAVVAGLVWFTPWGRRVVAKRVRTTGKQVTKTLRGLAHEPGRFVLLFGSTLAAKVAVIGA